MSLVEVENLVKGQIFEQKTYIPWKQTPVGNIDWFISTKVCQTTMTEIKSLCRREGNDIRMTYSKVYFPFSITADIVTESYLYNHVHNILRLFDG